MPTAPGQLSRRLGLVAALAAVLVLALTASPALARFAYVTSGPSTVSLLDTATNALVGTPIPVGEGPSTIAITPDGRTAYVGSDNDEDVIAIDTRTNQPVARIQLDADVIMIAISPDGGTAYVTRANGPNVVVLDLRANQVSGSPIPVGGSPQGVAFSPDGKTAYVSNPVDGTIRVIDTQARQAIGGPIPVGAGAIAFTPDGSMALTAEGETGNVSVIDTQTRQAIDSIPIAPGEEIPGLAITPDGRTAYVAARVSGVRAIDIRTRQVVAGPIPLGYEANEIAITPNGRTAYVTPGTGSSITAIDTATNQARTIPVPGGSFALAIVPNQSPLASFSAAPTRSSLRVKFDGSRSTDPDGAVAVFDWGFGDGASAANASPTPSHTYRRSGGFTANLTVIDDEGCSGAQVFTGRTAYCSGSALSTQARQIAVAPNRFKFGAFTRNAKKGTARIRIRVPAAGRVVLSGKGVKRVKRSVRRPSVLVLAIEPKAKLKAKLEAKGSARAKVRVSFRPREGQTFSKARSVRLRLN